MKNISSSSSFSELSRAADSLGYSLITANVGYELWEGENYKGGFTTLADAGEKIEQLHELHKTHVAIAVEQQQREVERRREEHKEQQKPFEAAKALLGDTVLAAVLLNEKVVGYCQVKPGTRSINIAGERSDGGHPVNVRTKRVSVSAKNINFVNIQLMYGLQAYTAFVYNNEIFYVPE